MSDVIHVLDSSAILCVVFNEPGIEAVKPTLNGALMSAANLAEVIAKLQDKGMPDDIVDEIIAGFKLTIADFDEELARVAGKMRNATRAKGLSLGDRACLALAQSRNAIAVTTDQAWKDTEHGVRILLVR